MFKYFCIPACILILSACDKGYEVRFSNYYIEPVDSVSVGSSGASFTNIDVKQQSNYSPVKTGNHALRIVTRSKNVITGLFPVPARGSGKYTIQIDGVKQISIIEDNP